MNSPSILIAYPAGGERTALDLVPTLEPLAIVSLRSYEKLRIIKDLNWDVAVCLVDDEESVSKAHFLQKALGETPTLVVNNGLRRTVAINGFAGLIPPAPLGVAEEVRRLLPPCADDMPDGEVIRLAPPATLVSRLDVTLSRLGELPGEEVLLASATRQLAREIGADCADAVLLNPKGVVRYVYTSTEHPSQPPPVVIRAVQKLTHLTHLSDLKGKGTRPLHLFLSERGQNVIAPMTRQGKAIGWIALKVRESLLTSDFLDDLHIATHLLSMSLAAAKKEEVPGGTCWNKVLNAFSSGLVLLDGEGQITDFTGALDDLGTELVYGASFKSIRNTRIREIIAEALSSRLMSEAWIDPSSGRPCTCSSALVSNGSIAIRLNSTLAIESSEGEKVDLNAVLAALPLPVTQEPPPTGNFKLSTGRIKVSDSQEIVRCAEIAHQQKAKTLRLRTEQRKGGGLAVLYFEVPLDNESRLPEAIDASVAFHVSL